ncbi:MAG: metal ABC transporter ATP-binding protein, partial [Lentisphaeria bacterium]|nr:metal ABC transporter ATP-binding protein [Lentisphaeria bacterium]
DLLILDEPAAGVDCHGETLFCEVLESLRAKWHFTQVMVSHDLSTVTHHATHVICLNRKVVAEGPPEAVLTPETLGSLFGLHMGIGRVQSMPADHHECSGNCCEGDHHA